MTIDVSLCVLAVWIAYFLRLSEWTPLYGPMAWAVVGSLVLAIPVFAIVGIYRPVFRHAEAAGYNQILFALLIYGLAYFTVFTAWSVPGVPRTVGIIQPVLLFVFMILARVLARYILRELIDRSDGVRVLPRVLIYGAGVSGRQLAAAIGSRREMKVAGFLDDNKGLQGASVNGIRIYSTEGISELVDKLVVDEVLLAIPSATQQRRNEILALLRSLRVRVRTLPDIIELVLNDFPNQNITNLDIHDLLGRDIVTPDRLVMNAHLAHRTILVTGAGGSIGSELCRQIIAANPSKILLFDNSEFSLYSIHRELEAFLAARATSDRDIEVELIPLLGSVQNEQRVDEIMACWKPSHVYHAAAYKHVPLVEHNPIQGVVNNVFGTMTVAQQCVKHKVGHFVLVSTDKAVRPTNTMGATKRLAEMVLQALSEESGDTCLSMVRFGNVLGSSGSVVPLFRQQILAGGPVTITDDRITRFFMTIPEAAQLVIQAGAMATGGEVFVLDMGEPVKIVDLARNMIELSGLTVRDHGNPFGDIELRVVGLRPGEKLYEELLIEDAPITTGHPRIRKAVEGFLPVKELNIQLQLLREAVNDRRSDKVRQILVATVKEFAPTVDVLDYVHINNHGAKELRQISA
ncbi:polysaccharide biosynthesis protein [Sphingomonas faeni]|uniref:polysaccharide biosynthesis protein n=1 Tax=Sphingomonas faeni TaxID=185950 RepID=UPI0027D76CDD|nr:nucleoside-diphosphate sugar epimerase/dehydratase [Sphingomonas faeni]